MGNILTREAADRIIVENYADCLCEISPDELAALARGDSLLLVIEDEYTVEIALAADAPPQDEDEACDLKNERVWQRERRLEQVVIEDNAFRSGRKPTPHQGTARLAGIIPKCEVGDGERKG